MRPGKGQHSARKNRLVVATYRCFIIANSSVAAWFIMDLSPLIPYYTTPAMQLYSATDAWVMIQPVDLLMKLNFISSFFQLKIGDQQRKFYGLLYGEWRLLLTRLPIGHSLVPSIMQLCAQAVAAVFCKCFGVSMVVYLDDWLIFWPSIPVHGTPLTIPEMGITINQHKSTATTLARIYLGLHLDASARTLQPTPELIPWATQQDLQRTVGCMVWLAHIYGKKIILHR